MSLLERIEDSNRLKNHVNHKKTSSKLEIYELAIVSIAFDCSRTVFWSWILSKYIKATNIIRSSILSKQARTT
jgi:hypothetical protein